MVTVRITEDLAVLIAEGGDPLDRSVRELIVLELYRRGTISSGKAAEVLGVPRIDFIKQASRLGIPYIQMSADDWAAEMPVVGQS